MQKEERVEGVAFRHEEIAELVMILGAMAAEHVFYGENSTGVGGDVQSVTMGVGMLVGAAAIGPEPVDLRGRVPEYEREEREQELMDRFERIGNQIINRLSGGPMTGDVHRRRARRPLQAARRRAHPGPGVHHRARLHAPQPRGRRARGRDADGAPRALRRRGHRGARTPRTSRRPAIDLLDEDLWPKVAA